MEHFIYIYMESFFCHFDTNGTPYYQTLANGMELRLGNGIYPCFFAFSRGGIWQTIPKSFLIFISCKKRCLWVGFILNCFTLSSLLLLFCYPYILLCTFLLLVKY